MRLRLERLIYQMRIGDMTWEFILGHMNYWLFIVLMLIGLYIVIAKGNLLKKIVGLNIFQVSVFMMYILF